MAEILLEHEKVNDKVRFTIDAWKRKLLDLSKRNRALNFKPNKVSTVTMLDEKSVEFFRLLCVEGKTLGFEPKPESENEEEKTAEHERRMKFLDSFLQAHSMACSAFKTSGGDLSF